MVYNGCYHGPKILVWASPLSGNNYTIYTLLTVGKYRVATDSVVVISGHHLTGHTDTCMTVPCDKVQQLVGHVVS